MFRQRTDMTSVDSIRPMQEFMQNRLNPTLAHLARQFVISLLLVLGRLKGRCLYLVRVVT